MWGRAVRVAYHQPMAENRWGVRLILRHDYTESAAYVYTGRELPAIDAVVEVSASTRPALGPTRTHARVLAIDPDDPFPISASEVTSGT